MSSLSSHLSSKRRLEIQAERDHSQTQLSLALSPVLTTGYYSETLSQSVSSRRSSSHSQHQHRRSTPPPAPLSARDEGVVIQAGMSFVLGHKAVRSASVSAIGGVVGSGSGRPSRSSTTSAATGVRQHFRPLPAHTMADTTSSLLSRAIRDFLGRTDHVMNEWKHLGKEGSGGVQRSRSSTRSYVAPQSGGHRRFSARSLSSSRYSSSDSPSSGNEFVVVGPFSRVPSFQSVRSTADTDFGSCQDLNDYDEVFPHFSLSLLPISHPFENRNHLTRSAGGR